MIKVLVSLHGNGIQRAILSVKLKDVMDKTFYTLDSTRHTIFTVLSVLGIKAQARKVRLLCTVLVNFLVLIVWYISRHNVTWRDFLSLIFWVTTIHMFTALNRSTLFWKRSSLFWWLCWSFADDTISQNISQVQKHHNLSVWKRLYLGFFQLNKWILSTQRTSTIEFYDSFVTASLNMYVLVHNWNWN